MKTSMAILFGIILCGGSFFIYTLPGDLIVIVDGWRIHAPLWMWFLITFLSAFVIFLFFIILRILFRLPTRFIAHLAERRLKKGVKGLNQFLTSYYAQDQVKILDKAMELEKYLPSPVVGLWCRARVLKNQQPVPQSDLVAIYKTLKTTTEGSFLGVYGLIEQARQDHDKTSFRKLLEEAFEVHPSSEWVKDQLVTFYLSEGLADKAQESIDRLNPRNAIEKERKNKARSQMWLLRAQEASGKSAKKDFLMEAHEACPSYEPAAVAYAEELVGLGKRSKALNVLEGAWKAKPTRAIAQSYLAQAVGKDALVTFDMARTLLSLAPESNLAKFIVIEAALQAQLWGEADRYLSEVSCVDNEPLYYELRARCCEEGEKNFEGARQWRKEGLEVLSQRSF